MKIIKHSLAVAIFTAILSSYNPALAQAEQLQTIVVTPQNTNQTAQSVTGNLTVIDRAQIERGQYQTFAEILQNQPGIWIKNYGGIGQITSIFMRGASSSDGHILLLIDGVAQSESFGFNPQNIPVHNIERIEVLKGPQSGIWGANASAGVINIITRPGGNHGFFNFEAGSNATRNFAAGFGAGDEKIDFAFDILSNKTDGFSATRAKNRSHKHFEDDGFELSGVNFKLGLNPAENHRIELLAKHSYSENEYDNGFPAHDPDDAFASNSYDKLTKSIQYKYQADSLSFRAYLNQNEVITDYGFGENNFQLTEAGLVAGLDYASNQNLTVAVNKKSLKDDSSAENGYKNQGVAVSNRNQIGNGLYLDQAIRFDEYNEFKNATTGKLGIKNYFSDSFYLAANLGTGYNVPSLYQIENSSQQLKPEEVLGGEISAGYQNFELTYFARNTKELLIDTCGFPACYSNQTGKTQEKGVEFSYSQQYPTINSAINFNYSWLDAKNKDRLQLGYRPKHQANLNYQFSGFNKTVLAMDARFVGKTYTDHGRQGEQIGNYTVFDLLASYQIDKNFKLQAKIINLLDNDYTTGIVDANHVYSNGGRQFFVKLSANF